MRFEDGDTFKKPLWPEQSSESVEDVSNFIKKGFGASEWITLHGFSRNYYFNMDLAYSNVDDRTIATRYHNVVADFLSKGIEVDEFRNRLGDQEPILAYICPDGAPVGIVQARGILAEKLGWPSVLVFPEKRLLRSRVIAGQNESDFPNSVAWLARRHAFLLCDTVTTGESIARAVGALRSFGCSALAAIAIFNRDEGAEESLALINLPLYGIVNSTQAPEYISDTSSKASAKSNKNVRDPSIYVCQAS